MGGYFKLIFMTGYM